MQSAISSRIKRSWRKVGLMTCAAVWLAAATGIVAQEESLLRRRGDAALAQGDFPAAQRHFKAAAKGSLAPGRAWLGAGKSAFAQADYEAAARQFNYASLANGATPADEALALAGKAAAGFEAARETMEENAVAQAVEECFTALERDPKCVLALVWRGYIRTLRALNQEEENNALADLKAAHAQGEDGWLIFLARGCIAIGHGDTAERDKAFRHARTRLDAELKSRPMHLHAWLKSVELSERSGDVDRLIADHTPAWYRDRAQIHDTMGRPDLARKDLNTAKDLEARRR